MLINPKDINFSKFGDNKVVAKQPNWHDYNVPEVIKLDDNFYNFDKVRIKDENCTFLDYIKIDDISREQLLEYIKWEEHCIHCESESSLKEIVDTNYKIKELQEKVKELKISRSDNYKKRYDSITNARVIIFDKFESAKHG